MTLHELGCITQLPECPVAVGWPELLVEIVCEACKRVLCDMCDDETLFLDSDWRDTVEGQCDEC